jgi:5'-3' exoribonuclease 2
MNSQHSSFSEGGSNGGDPFESGEGDHFPYLKPFQLLHIPILREYLQAEFRCLETVPFQYDFERIVDDFVFMCFFVGNDFLPHLPSLDIRDGAIDFLYNVYKRLLPAMGGYLTLPGGEVNLERVDILLSEVGRIEDEVRATRQRQKGCG